VDAGQRRAHRHRAGPDEQRVEPDGVRAAGLQVARPDLPAVEVDLLDLGTNADVDGEGVPKTSLGAG